MKEKLPFYLFIVLIACAVLSLIMVVSCREPAGEVITTPPLVGVGGVEGHYENVEADYITGRGLDFGIGLDAVSQNVRSNCFEKSITSEQTPGRIVTKIKVKIVKEQSELESVLGISGSTRLNIGLWTASAGARYLNERQSHVNSVFAVVSTEVEGYQYSAKNIRLTEKNEKLWEDDYVKFRDKCGDLYLDSITTGGKYLGIIEIMTSSTQEKNQVASSLTGRGGMAELTSDFKNSLNEISQQYRLDFEEIIIGGSPKQEEGEVGEITIESMIKKAQRFAVDDFDPKVASYKVLFKEYRLVADDPAGDVVAHKKAMDSLVEYYDKYYELWEDLQYIQAHPGDYPKVKGWEVELSDGETYAVEALQHYDPNENRRYMGFIQKMLNDILTAATDCESASGKCSSKVPPNMVSDYNTILYEFPVDEVHPPRNCADIKVMFPMLGDDEYTVYYQGKEDQPYKVYCHNLQTNNPIEYLTLIKFNRSGMSAGGADAYYRGTDVTTEWHKIRINPDNLWVDINDTTHAKSSGQITFYPWQEGPRSKWKADWTTNFSPYAYPRNCNCDKDKNRNSYAAVDLRGTPFAVRDDVHWDLKKNVCTKGSVNWLDDKRQQARITASSASCGWAKPVAESKNQLFLEYIGN